MFENFLFLNFFFCSQKVGCVWTNSNVFLSGADDGKLILWGSKQQQNDLKLKEVKMKEISKFKPY